MDLDVFFAFFIATSIMIALPGPSVILTVAHSISFGWKNALLTVLGATVGIAIQLLIAIIGLASILHMAAEVFTWVRWAGAAYLVYLGVRQWMNSKNAFEFDEMSVSKMNLFAQGVIVTVPNPKSLIFIAAFLPQFIDMTRPLGGQLAIIVPTFLMITFGVTSIWAIAAGSARTAFRKSGLFTPLMRSAGGLMILAGLGMVLVRRSN
ncbi:MAG: LysE family translocator [Desulfovibrio sp.]|uniref:LysE family translocator n=1 Tax=Desulfovibrio sp. 7SRBS1 TaxID=3378064 RepID=UPI003B3CDEEF